MQLWAVLHHTAWMAVQEMQPRALIELHCTDAVQEMQSRGALHGLGAGNAALSPLRIALQRCSAGNAIPSCPARIGCRKCSSEPSPNCTARMQCRKCNRELPCKDWVQEMQPRSALLGLGAGNATVSCPAWIGCRKCSSGTSMRCTARTACRKCDSQLCCTTLQGWGAGNAALSPR